MWIHFLLACRATAPSAEPVYARAAKPPPLAQELAPGHRADRVVHVGLDPALLEPPLREMKPVSMQLLQTLDLRLRAGRVSPQSLPGEGAAHTLSLLPAEGRWSLQSGGEASSGAITETGGIELSVLLAQPGTDQALELSHQSWLNELVDSSTRLRPAFPDQPIGTGGTWEFLERHEGAHWRGVREGSCTLITPATASPKAVHCQWRWTADALPEGLREGLEVEQLQASGKARYLLDEGAWTPREIEMTQQVILDQLPEELTGEDPGAQRRSLAWQLSLQWLRT